MAGGDGTVSAGGGGRAGNRPAAAGDPGRHVQPFRRRPGASGPPRTPLAALRAGEAVLVDVGIARARSFINTSSTGVYVDLVHARQELEGRSGRRPAELVALVKVLRRSRPHELILDGTRRRLWLYFAGNCRYEPPGWPPPTARDLCDGCLDIRMVEARPAGQVAPGRRGADRHAGPLPRLPLRGGPDRSMSVRWTASRSGCPSTARWPPPNQALSRASTGRGWSSIELPPDDAPSGTSCRLACWRARGRARRRRCAGPRQRPPRPRRQQGPRRTHSRRPVPPPGRSGR